MSEVEETMSVVGYEWSDCSKCKNLFCKKSGTPYFGYCNHYCTDYISHQCAICKELELPYAKVTAFDFWICPSCRQKIGKMIGVTITDG